MWEYKVVSSSNEIIDKPNKFESNSSDDGFLELELNDYGRYGWELINIIPYMYTSGLSYEESIRKYRYIFKRHK